MKSFIDKQIELLSDAICTMRKIKQGERLLAANPNNEELLSLSGELKLKYFETIHELIKDYMPSNESNVVASNVVGISEAYFENKN